MSPQEVAKARSTVQFIEYAVRQCEIITRDNRRRVEAAPVPRWKFWAQRPDQEDYLQVERFNQIKNVLDESKARCWLSLMEAAIEGPSVTAGDELLNALIHAARPGGVPFTQKELRKSLPHDIAAIEAEAVHRDRQSLLGGILGNVALFYPDTATRRYLEDAIRVLISDSKP